MYDFELDNALLVMLKCYVLVKMFVVLIESVEMHIKPGKNARCIKFRIL